MIGRKKTNFPNDFKALVKTRVLDKKCNYVNYTFHDAEVTTIQLRTMYARVVFKNVITGEMETSDLPIGKNHPDAGKTKWGYVELNFKLRP